jgi:hypothetical protein
MMLDLKAIGVSRWLFPALPLPWYRSAFAGWAKSGGEPYRHRGSAISPGADAQSRMHRAPAGKKAFAI